MTRGLITAAALLLAVVALAVLAPVERLVPESQTDEPMGRQLCWAGSLYAGLLAPVARLHLAGGGMQTPAMLVDRIERLYGLCGDSMSLPDGFAELACRVGRVPPPPAACPGS